MTDLPPETPRPPVPEGSRSDRLEGNQPATSRPLRDADSVGPSGGGAPTLGGRLADGEWHRLHPASPLLKGGVALIVILGVVIANMRERIMDLFLPRYNYQGDPVDFVLDNGLIGWVLLGVAVLLVALIVGFYVSWRMHTFRITDEVVEVRSGILFRTNRKARLDRIQGINIVRPVFARIFGAAKLEISQAGQDANVQLSYLGSLASDDLRREILRLASGTQETSAPVRGAVEGESVIERRVNEFLAPELDPDAAPPESIVKLNLGRLIGSLVLSSTTVTLVLFTIATIIFVAVSEEFLVLLLFIPFAIAFGSFYVRKFTKSLRYSIAGTADGIRVGFGLLSTSNETLPPGRIHSVQVSQPLLWRGPGWWEIKVNRASHSSTKGAGGEDNTTLLPVGDRGDVLKVLALILPELAAPVVGDGGGGGDDREAGGAERGEGSAGGGFGESAGATRGVGAESWASEGERDESEHGVSSPAARTIELGLGSNTDEYDPFTTSPRRACWLRWFSWRRNGFAITTDSLVLRKGAIWRQLVIVPQPRLQSVSLHQGPLLRVMRLASVQLHTVSGPISADLGALDRDDAAQFFEEVSRVAVDSAQSDTSHRWRAKERPA